MHICARLLLRVKIIQKDVFSSPVLGLPRVTLHIQKLINYLWGFQFLPYQEQHCHHASYLWCKTTETAKVTNQRIQKFERN